jgi:LAGLIDADG-like domain
VGKLLAVDTLIATPGGLQALTDIGAGDQVIDERGVPCAVTAVYDAIPERAYRMTFDDGLQVIAGGEHQWVTITRGQRKGYFRRDRPRDAGRGPRPAGYPDEWARWGAVRDTGLIAATLRTSDGGYEHTIPVARPVQLPAATLPVDPYLLGVWLGDGGARDSVISTSFAPEGAPTTDAEFIAGQFISAGYTLGAWQRGSGRGVTFRALGFEPELRALGVLGRKHVPDSYLFASADQRLALLQGLMDTDGSVSSSGHVEFTAKDEPLAAAVTWLASSLGQRARRNRGRATFGGVDYGPKYRVQWASSAPVFRLPRKLRLLRTASVRSQSRMIVASEPIPVQPMRCLTVDSPNLMYLITER